MVGNASEPLLVRCATPRSPGEDIPGCYSQAQRMWVVENSNGYAPLISVASDLAEITTKTKVELESDDTVDPNLAQLVTKTDVQTERDDESRGLAMVLALTTKTEAKTEEDRQDMGIQYA